MAIQVGAAAVPPVALLAAVHGIALAVRAGASGTVYRWAIAAVAVIGAGAFMLSFRALRDLLIQTGTPPAWAWIFPAIIDAAVAVSTMMLAALGDKPTRRAPRGGTQTATVQTTAQTRIQSAKAEVKRSVPTGVQAQTVQAEHAHTSVSAQPNPAQTLQDSVQTEATQADADLASELIASGVTTQPVETVVAVLWSHRRGASINAAAKASGINYRTAQRIVEGAAERRQQHLAAVG
jgi:ribosomal protein L18